ncbi:MAG: chaperone modulator CbpM [Aestuariivirgaceae bacterium]
MRKREILIAGDIDPERLSAWIDAGWLCPDSEKAEPGSLSDADLARAQLICDLKDDLGVNDEGVEVILDLLDQIHGLRLVMREMLSR